MDQYHLGWSPMWDHYLSARKIDSFVRVSSRHKQQYTAITTCGEQLNCYLSGKLARVIHEQSQDVCELPAVGDWCLIGERFLNAANEPSAVISEVLPRRSQIARSVAGTETGEQVLAANLDFAFIVTSLNRDFNLNRLSRFLVVAEQGGVTPVLVLSKSDLNEIDREQAAAEIRSRFPRVRQIFTSAVMAVGIEELAELLTSGKAGVFLGSSGVGKSSLVNALLGIFDAIGSDRERVSAQGAATQSPQATGAIRLSDGRGRHTTSRSDLLFLPSGGIIIDTAGLREIKLSAGDGALESALPGVSEFARACRFRDCLHKSEPGCKVRSALEEGDLDESEYANYESLEREIAFSKRKVDQRLAQEERKRWKKITVQNRNRSKGRWNQID